jgi:hypothetical protein
MGSTGLNLYRAPTAHSAEDTHTGRFSATTLSDTQAPLDWLNAQPLL